MSYPVCQRQQSCLLARYPPSSVRSRTLLWTIWTSMSAVLKKAVKLNHSLTHSLALCSLYPSRAPPSQVPTVLDKKTVVTAPTVMGHPDTTGCGISCSSQLIQQMRCSPRSTSTSPRTQPVLHGCISNSLGSQLASSSILRTVVKPRILSAHQLAGA